MIDDWHFDDGVEKLNAPMVSCLISENANVWPINTTVYLLQPFLLILQLLETLGRGGWRLIFIFQWGIESCSREIKKGPRFTQIPADISALDNLKTTHEP